MDKIYFRKAIFSHTPINGYYKFDNNLQLLPIDKEFKRHLLQGYPMILEFCFDRHYIWEGDGLLDMISRPIVEGTYANLISDEIMLLLSSLTNHRFFTYKTNKLIDINKEKKSEESKTVSEILQESSDNSSELCEIENFSELKCSEINKIEPIDYYYKDSEEYITFPNHLDNLFEKYYSLNEDARNAYYSSCILFCNGYDIYTEMNSLSFIAFVSSIESLIDFDSKEKPQFCEKCEQRIIKAKKKFRQFLLDNSLPIIEYKEYIDEFYKRYKDHFDKYGGRCYDTRSDIAHRGKLLYYDLYRYGVILDKEKFDKWKKESEIHDRLMKLTRICHVGWLLRQ